MNRDADPLLDKSPCAGCWNDYHPSRLCCCDEDPGPCCDDGCCEREHGRATTRKAAA